MPIRTVDPRTAHAWHSRQEAVLIDVREPAEYAAEHPEGAISGPIGTLYRAALPLSAGKRLVFSCRSGMRSAQACEKILKEQPSLEVYSMEGGLSAWEKQGLPVVRGERRVLPLDRQVQLSIGLMLLLFTGLGFGLSTLWFLPTGAIGLGLTVAGLTGFCGLARLIASAPWNR